MERHHQDKMAAVLIQQSKEAAKNYNTENSDTLLHTIAVEKIDFNIHSKNIRDKPFNLQRISD